LHFAYFNLHLPWLNVASLKTDIQKILGSLTVVANDIRIESKKKISQ